MILIPLLVAAASAAALPAAPEAAMVRFLDLNARAALQGTEGKALLAGELDRMEAPTFGSLAAPDKIEKIGVGGAVARIPSDASHPDLYFFLTRGPAGWTITAIRALALTGIAAEMIRMDEAHPSSDPRVRQAVKNARLTLSPDRELLAWAAANRPLLDRARANPDAPGLEAALKQAGGNRAYREGGTIHVSIGGIVDNEVGFLWTDGKPPAMDPQSYIWIEAAGNGWYLYKTT